MDHDDSTADHSVAPAVRAPETAEVVRSEERLHLTTDVHPVARIRIGKRVVTEERVVTVTVRREELFVEEVATDSGRAQDEGLLVQHSGDLVGAGRATPPVVEMWLSEEEVEVTTRTVPRQRVRLFVDTVTEHVEVGGTVAREVVEVDDSGPAQGVE